MTNFLQLLQRKTFVPTKSDFGIKRTIDLSTIQSHPELWEKSGILCRKLGTDQWIVNGMEDCFCQGDPLLDNPSMSF